MYKSPSKLLGKLANALLGNKPRKTNNADSGDEQQNQPKHKCSASLETNVQYIQNALGQPTDLVKRSFVLPNRQIKGAMIFLDSLTDKTILGSDVLERLFLQLPLISDEKKPNSLLYDFIDQSSVTSPELQKLLYLEDGIKDLLLGHTLIFLQGSTHLLSVSAKAEKTRAISEPATETVVRGPREGFTESLSDSLGMVRKHLKSPALRLEGRTLGKHTQTKVVLAYLEGIAPKTIVEEARRRLADINVDSILESGYIEELVEDNPYSPFPQIEHSERPDKVCGALLEGRIAIITEGTPFVLMAPTTFFQFLQSSEDYYERYYFGTAIRWIRIVAFHIAFLLPSLYIAGTTIHQEMIPTKLALSIAGARAGVPLPALAEALLMETTFEMLREAGIRLPKPVGQAVSIVGALVIGQAAVEAGIISPMMIIVVSITAIASFSVPAYNMAISLRILRFPMMFMASILGLPGVVLGMMVILMHLVSLRSFGMPYWSPIAPFSLGDFKDILIRAPWWAMSLRPRLIGYKAPLRQGKDLMPKPPNKQSSSVKNKPDNGH